MGEDGKLNPSPVVAAINRALQRSRTGQVSINWGMVVRSLLGLCSIVSENVTYVDMTGGIGISAAAEEKTAWFSAGLGSCSPAAARTSCWPS